MKLLIALYFFILAIIQMGLFFGINHYYRSKNSVKPSRYWMSSLLISVLGLIIFGAGIIVIDDILKPEFNFTVANASFYVPNVLVVKASLPVNSVAQLISLAKANPGQMTCGSSGIGSTQHLSGGIVRKDCRHSVESRSL